MAEPSISTATATRTSASLRSFVVRPDTRYVYYYVQAEKEKATLLFLHGFPSGASDWAYQIEYLSGFGFGVIAPDLLGYAPTTSPESVSAYNWRDMCSHVDQILIHERATKVIAVGHDLGSWMLSRFLHFHPKKLIGVVFLDVGYAAPGDRFDVDLINRMSKEMTGTERFRYWDLFTEKHGVHLLNKHPASFLSLMYAANPSVMADNLGPAGKTREWLDHDQIATTGDWLPQGALAVKTKIFLETGFDGALNWYKALRTNASFEDEKDMPKDYDIPTLVIAATRDEMTVASLQRQLTEPYVKGYFRFVAVESGHWVMLEKFKEVNELLREFADGLAL